MSKDLEETRFGLEFLADHANHRVNIEPSSRVLDLESLLLFLFKQSSNSNIVSLTCVNDILKSHTYDYTPNSFCSYHEEKETIHCSLHTVKTFCYQISDYICSIYDIRELTNNHVPVREEVATIITHENFPSSKSFKYGRGYGTNNKRSYQSLKYEQDEVEYKDTPSCSKDTRMITQPKAERKYIPDKYENCSVVSKSSVSYERFEYNSSTSNRVKYENRQIDRFDNLSGYYESNQSFKASFKRHDDMDRKKRRINE